MSDYTCIHIVYPLHEDRGLSPLDVRVATHRGSVEEVTAEIQRGIEADGHTIEKDGGDWTRQDGKPRALSWQIEVTLESGFSMRWQHIVRESGDLWKRIPKPKPVLVVNEEADAYEYFEEGH